ncbi:hypothetical protein [Sulfurimonas sp.]|uniref:hypothetical protein n=1 Tax=Sulfurimonas sp. TaxID=2022749 RepID=UPI002A36B996|nr:hypothetical protein [Sulfurimonas sp.]MDY0122965.1 hypothetical protein [Sulfurimonas sp.]
MENQNTIYDPFSNPREKGPRKIRYEKPVKQDYDLPLEKLENYFTNKGIQSGGFFQIFKEYKGKKIKYKINKFTTLLQHISDENLLLDNKELYSEISIFLDYASEENLLHKVIKEEHKNFLKRALFANNKDSIDSSGSDTLEALDYSKYQYNNFRKSYKNEAINNIHARGGTIFLNSDGKICCRFSKDSEIKIYSKRQAETILSAALRFAIKITEDVPSYTDIDPSTILLSDATVRDGDDEKR